MRNRQLVVIAFFVVSVSAVSTAHAQWAVVDVGAIAQLVQQIATMQDQLNTARDQLTQARQTLNAMRGARGMERLLSGTVRNYLPRDWSEIDAVMRGAGGYGGLSAEVQAAIAHIAVLSQSRIGRLSAEEREQLLAARGSAALLQGMTRQALATTSARFESIQQLVDAIPRAQDQKAILDLQARIAAEQTMLANDQTKLDVLYQTAQAEELARKQRIREQAIASVGSLRTLPAMGL